MIMVMMIVIPIVMVVIAVMMIVIPIVMIMIAIMMVVVMTMIAIMMIVFPIPIFIPIPVFIFVLIPVFPVPVIPAGIRDIGWDSREKNRRQQAQEKAGSFGDEGTHRKRRRFRAPILVIISIGASFFVRASKESASRPRGTETLCVSNAFSLPVSFMPRALFAWRL